MLLMENAARSAGEMALSMLPDLTTRSTPVRIAILLGTGNNAGDGYALARHMDRALGKQVHITLFALRDPSQLKGDAAINAAITKQLGLTLHVMADAAAVDTHARSWVTCDLIVDALLGTGFSGEVRSPMDRVIASCNAAHEKGVKVLALDLPSGLNGDTGEPASATIKADVTATFLAAKQGLLTPAAKPYVGRVVVCDIGIHPTRLLDEHGNR